MTKLTFEDFWIVNKKEIKELFDWKRVMNKPYSEFIHQLDLIYTHRIFAHLIYDIKENK